MRDDDKLAINVVSEDEGKLIVQDPAGKKETYYLNPIRNMRLFVEALQVSCGTSSMSFDKPKRLPPPEVAIRGTALLEGGRISVIGEPSNRSRSFSISLKAFDEADVTRQEEELGHMPHTVSLGFLRRDWEIGNDDEWFIECYVAPQMMDAITSAVSAKTLQRMTLNLRLERIYSDDNWAPPSAGSDWFLRPARSDNTLQFPEMAHGAITQLSLGLANVDLRPKSEPEVDEPDVDDVPDMYDDGMVPKQTLDAIKTLGTDIEKLTAAVKTVGWAIALGLLFLVLK